MASAKQVGSQAQQAAARTPGRTATRAGPPPPSPNRPTRDFPQPKPPSIKPPKNTTGVPNSGKQIVTNFLNQYGLGSLANWAWNVYTGTGGGTTGMDAITAELPNQGAFKARFPAYDQLAKEGRAMSVAEMLSYEQTARQIFKANGLPDGFYDTPKDLAQFMLNDVSTAELETRVKTEQQAVFSSPQDVRDELSRLYGVDAGHLTAFFLDPKVAEPLIAQKFTSAQIAAEADRTNFGQISKTQAEHLSQLGVTDQQAQTGFSKLGQEAGLFQAQVQGEQVIGPDQQIAGQFAGDSTALLAFQQRQAQRLASFKETSGFGTTQKGMEGLAPTQQAV